MTLPAEKEKEEGKRRRNSIVLDLGRCGAMAFALLDCLPGMLFTLVLFRDRLRYGKGVTAIACVALVAVQMLVGSLRYGHIDDNAYMAMMAVIVPAIWGIPMIGLIRDSWRKIVFVLMLFMNLSGTITIIGNAADRWLLPDGACLPYDWRYLLMVVFAGVALIAVLYALFGRVLLELFRVQDADHVWRYLWLVPAGFSVIALWMRFGTPEPEYISTAKPANFLCLMMLFATKLGTYLIVSRIVLVQRQRNELQTRNRQYELHERAYRIYQERDEAERRLRHDFRHQLVVISRLAEEGKIGELRAYIEEMMQSMPTGTRSRLASDPELDALLQYYRYEAERAGVRFTSRIEAPIEQYVKAVDLTVMLGNLLENAVHAAGSASGERYVDLHIGKVVGICMIVVRNSYDGSLDERNGRFLSTKHEGMGMGLESVRLTAQRLRGECSVKHSGHEFTVRVSLPAQESR